MANKSDFAVNSKTYCSLASCFLTQVLHLQPDTGSKSSHRNQPLSVKITWKWCRTTGNKKERFLIVSYTTVAAFSGSIAFLFKVAAFSDFRQLSAFSIFSAKIG